MTTKEAAARLSRHDRITNLPKRMFRQVHVTFVPSDMSASGGQAPSHGGGEDLIRWGGGGIDTKRSLRSASLGEFAAHVASASARLRARCGFAFNPIHNVQQATPPVCTRSLSRVLTKCFGTLFLDAK